MLFFHLTFSKSHIIKQSLINLKSISGATKNRPELDKMLEHFREGDELYVWRLNRLGRSLKNIIDLVLSLSGKGVIIKGLVDGVDTSTINGSTIS
ncbi:recombinase family protein [Chryseobacterium indoltheticum]|uniref:recombinase family protein n=1 Tax=Chryseobacterium indoltheticum TaxID=254 RepID=UPI0040415646